MHILNGIIMPLHFGMRGETDDVAKYLLFKPIVHTQNIYTLR